MQVMAEQALVRIAICVATFRRPNGLAKLLESLAKMHEPPVPSVIIKIFVVDNDAAGTAREITRRYSEHLPWPLHYEIEPRRGICYSRNRAVALASNFEFIAFVDDDEVVDPAWLNELINTQKKFSADVVVGPVLSVFLETPPDWIVTGRFFEYGRHLTGTQVRFANTNNVLIRRAILDELSGPFDSRFALSGGGDTFLSLQLRHRDRSIVWCDSAIVYEYVPASRMRSKWILQRAYRHGNASARCDKLLDDSRAIRKVFRLAKGSARIAQGALGLVPALLFGKPAWVKMAADISRGAGMVTGILGHTYEEYKKIHGG
jgi:succinoglycan biosynthesis protein ExoM